MAATIFRFSNDGTQLGMLDYDEAIHTEALDGTDKLIVTSAGSPSKRDKLVWQDVSGEWHEHMVDEIKRTHAGHQARTQSTCSNSISELYGSICSGTKSTGTVAEIMSEILAGTRWNIGECSDFGVVEIEVYHKNARQCIAELCEMVGGEIVTRITVGDSGVESRTVAIVRERGSSAVFRQFEWSKNVTSITREISSDEVYTAIIGFGAKLSQEDDSEYPQRLTVNIESNLDLTKWGIPDGLGNFNHNYTTYTDSQCTSTEFLTKQCRSVLNSVCTPLVRYELDAAEVGDDLWKDVRLGDRVMCIDKGFSPPLELIERVSEIQRRLSGRIQCRISVGSRVNPLVEQFKSNEKISRQTTGNSSRISSSRPIFTGGDYVGDTMPDYEIEPSDGEPTYIQMINPPRKTSYAEGEAISLDGIQVVAYYDGGAPYDTPAYPGGVIPINELTITPSTAQKVPDKTQTRVTKSFGEVTVSNTPIDTVGVWYTLGTGDPDSVKWSELVAYSYIDYPGRFDPYGSGNHTFKRGNVYLRNSNVGNNTGGPFVYESGDEATIALLESMGVDFSADGFEAITVSWSRPSDGGTLETSFNISVRKNELPAEDISDKSTGNMDEPIYIWGDPSILYPELYQ